MTSGSRNHTSPSNSERDQNRELSTALKSIRGVFVHLGAFSFFVSLLMLTGPLYMLQVYDRVLMSQSVPTLVALTLLILVLFFTLGVLEWVRSSLFMSAASKFEGILSDRVANAAMDLSRQDPGHASEKPLRNLRLLRRFLSSPVLNTLFDLPWSPLFFAVLFMLHPIFGLWALFGAVVLFCLSWLNQRSSEDLMKASEQTELLSQQHAIEIMRNAEVIDALGMRSNVKERWKDSFDSSDKSLFDSGRRLAMFTSTTRSFRLFLQSAILGIGAWLIIKGSGGASTHGEMIAASILMGRAIAPIEQIVGQWRSIIGAREAWYSLNRLLANTPQTTEKIELPQIQGNLTVEAIYAGPHATKKPVLKAVSFSILPGDVLGILGPSAAGKSSLARVLIGTWPTMSGNVRLDGADLAAYDKERLGKQIGYLPQQVDLLSGSVKQNIARFDPDASAEAIIEAAKTASCHDLILELKDGYETEVGLSGAYLSAGQRQRIGLARALYGTPKFVVLDEPNSNLDAPGEDALQKAIAQLQYNGSTIVIIAHRPNAIVHCNKLLVLDNGELKAFGPRDEVLKKIMPKTTAPNVKALRTRTESNG